MFYRSRQLVLMVTSVFLLLLGATGDAQACDADDLEEFEGFTLLEITAIPDEFEGADFDKAVKLENGMVFEFTEYNYAYAYNPSVAVFAMEFSLERVKKIDPKATKPLTLYKLLIEDETYDVVRIR